MAEQNNGANEDTSLDDLQKLLDEDQGTTTPSSNEVATEGESTPEQQLDQTKAFAKRLREEKEKIRKEEREALAKEAGYSSYDEFLKQKEARKVEEAGLDPDAFQDVFNKLYEERIKEDPRMRELDEYRNAKAEEWAKNQLKEITELTGGKITKLDQIEKAVFDAVTPGGSLVNAYMSLHGREVVEQLRNAKKLEQSNGSTLHLNSSSSTPPSTTVRELTPDEKSVMSQFATYSQLMQKALEEGKIKMKK